MNRIVLSTTLALAAVTPFAMHGADASGTENPNRFSLGARIGLNVKAKFHNSNLYYDGYVNRDVSGDDRSTWNWGYKHGPETPEQNQVVGDPPQFIQFHAIQSDSLSVPADRKADDAQYGLELIYQRVLGAISSRSSVGWGLEAAFGYTDLDLRDSRSGPVTVTTDRFPLNGVLPPGAEYNGTFDGPGPLLGLIPDLSTTASATATLASSHKLSGQSFGFRLGPFAEFYFTPQLSLAASLGLALAPTSVDYDFSESVTLAGGTSVATGHASETEVLYGYYLSALLRYDFNESWGLYIGAQFQSLTDLKLSAGSRTARLDQGATVYATVGASWRF